MNPKEIEALIDAMGLFPAPGDLSVEEDLAMSLADLPDLTDNTKESAARRDVPIDETPLSEEQTQALLELFDRATKQKAYQSGFITERPPLPTDPVVISLNDKVSAILNLDDANTNTGANLAAKRKHLKRFFAAKIGSQVDAVCPWRKDLKGYPFVETADLYTYWMTQYGLKPTANGKYPWELTRTDTLSSVSQSDAVVATRLWLQDFIKFPGSESAGNGPANPFNILPVGPKNVPASTTAEPLPAATEAPESADMAVVVLNPSDKEEYEVLKNLLSAGHAPESVPPAGVPQAAQASQPASSQSATLKLAPPGTPVPGPGTIGPVAPDSLKPDPDAPKSADTEGAAPKADAPESSSPGSIVIIRPPPASPKPETDAPKKRSIASPVGSLLRIPDALKTKYRPKGGFVPGDSSISSHELKPSLHGGVNIGKVQPRHAESTPGPCRTEDEKLMYAILGGLVISAITSSLLIICVVKLYQHARRAVTRWYLRRRANTPRVVLPGNYDIENQSLVEIPQPAMLK